MKKERLFQKVLSVILTLSLVVALAVPAGAAGNQVSFQKVDNSAVTGTLRGDPVEPVAEEPEYADTDVVRVSIILEKKSTISAGYVLDDIALNEDAMAYRAAVRAEQDVITSRIEQKTGCTLDVVWNLTLAANIISADVPYGQIEQIKSVNGVKNVVIENVFYPAVYAVGEDAAPNMVTSPVQTGSYMAWDAGYTGAGTRIAVIDTGIDVTHQSFDASAYEYALALEAAQRKMTPETYKAELDLLDLEELNKVKENLNINSKFPQLDCSQLYKDSKIPFGFSYCKDDLGYDVTHETLTSDGSEHGSHVSGICAANAYIPNEDGTFSEALETVNVAGVAPNAQLIGMRVFSTGGARESDFMVAIEDAIILGADSINLSLGTPSAGNSKIAEEEYQKIFDNLQQSGAVVCISAGNAGHWADYALNGAKLLYNTDVASHTGGSPGTYTNSLCVASVNNVGQVGNYFTVGNAKIGYTESTEFTNKPFTTIAGEQEFVLIEGVGSVDDWAAVGDALKGKIAICSRGSCTFVEKAENAVAAGALATLIYNNEPGSIRADLTAYTKENPVAMLTQQDAQTIIDAATPVMDASNQVLYYTGKMTVEMNPGVIMDNSEFFTMSEFSSWGVPGSLEMKPEITAPGGGIYSVFGKTGSGIGGSDAYELMSGTSMSSPQVAGMAALVMQYIRENHLDEKTGMNPRHLAQSLLMSTAVPMMIDYQQGIYPVMQQGAGLANVGLAVNADSYITMHADATDSWDDGKVKVEWGDDPARTGTYSFTFDINNLTDTTKEYAIQAILFTQGLASADAEGSVLYTLKGTVPLDFTAKWSVDNPDLVQVPANGKVTVTGTLTLTDSTKQDLDLVYPNGAFIEGYVAVGTATPRVENADAIQTMVSMIQKPDATNHFIPCLGFYGNWGDPSMFDVGSYLEYEHGMENRAPYLGKTETNVFSIAYGDGSGTYYFGGNPLIQDDTYMPERNAINTTNGDHISKVTMSVIRNAADGGFEVLNHTTDSVLYQKHTGMLRSAYFDATTQSWMGSTQNQYLQYVPDGEITENDQLEVRFYAVPECKIPEPAARTAGAYASENVGKGTYLSVPMVADNTAPEVVDITTSLLGKDMLRVYASDNQYIAAAILFDHTGSNLIGAYGADQNAAPGDESEFAFDISGANGNKFLLQIADYAMNITTYEVKLNQADNEIVLPEMLAFDQDCWINFNQNTTPSGNPDAMRQFDAFVETDLDVYAASAADGYLFAATGDQMLYIMPVEDLTDVTAVGKMETLPLDMAFNPADGQLYGVDGVNLFRIDRLTADVEVVGEAPLLTNTLAIDENGVFYCNDFGTSEVYSFQLDEIANPDLSLDFNDDGFVSSKDAEALLAFCAYAVDGISNAENADLNKNGKIDTNDAYALLEMLSSGKVNGLHMLVNVKIDGLPFQTSNVQAMEINPNTGMLCWTSYNTDDQAYYLEINPADGSYTVYNDMIDNLAALAIPEQDDDSWADPVDQVQDVQMLHESVNMLKNSKVELQAIVRPWTVTDRSVVWTTENADVADVNDMGVVTGVGLGTTTITATSVLDPSASASCQVTVESINTTISGILQDVNGDPHFFSWDFAADDTWTAGGAVDTTFVSATKDLRNNDYYVLDGENMHRVNRDGVSVATAPNGTGVPLWDLAYSNCFSQENAPAVYQVIDYFVLSADDPMMLSGMGFNFKGVVPAPLATVATIGFEQITDSDTGEKVDTEHVVALCTDGTVLDMFMILADGGENLYLNATPSDLSLNFPGYGDSMFCSMVAGDDGYLYLSYFNGEANDIYRLGYDEISETYVSQYVETMGLDVWPVSLTEAKSGEIVDANRTYADLQKLSAETVSAETLQDSAHMATLKQKNTATVNQNQEESVLNDYVDVFVPNSRINVLEDNKLIITEITAMDLKGNNIAVNNGLYAFDFDETLFTPVGVASNGDYAAVGVKDGKLYLAFAGRDTIAEDTASVLVAFTYAYPEETCFVIEHLEANETEPNYTEYLPLFRENCPSAKFTDVSPCGYMHKGIDYMVSNGYMSGTSETTFEPHTDLTRGQLMAILYRISGDTVENPENAYSDVAETAYYYKAIAWATENGIAAGYDDGTFKPNQEVTRQELAAFLYRFNGANAEVPADVLDAFADRDQISAYAVKAAAWAVSNGYIFGVSDTEFAPQDLTTRGQAASILYRYCISQDQ